MPASPQAYLRAINAPPIMGPYSAMTTTNYTGAGIGVGPGGQMIRKSPQEIDAAAAAWDAILGGGNRFAGLIFGDTPGAAQSNVLSLRAAREAEALNRAQLAFQQSNAAAQLRAQQQNNALVQQLKKYEIDQQAGLGQAKLAYQDADSMRDFLSRLTGTAAKGGTASDPAAIQAILEGKNTARQSMDAASAGLGSLAEQAYEAAQLRAEQLGGTVKVGRATGKDWMPRITAASRDTDPTHVAEVVAAARTGTQGADPMLSQIPLLGAVLGPAADMAASRDLPAQYEALRQQFLAGRTALAGLNDLGRGAGTSTRTSGGGLSPELLQVILQMTTRAPGVAPAPMAVGGRAFGAVPPPLTVLDQLNTPFRTPIGPSSLPATRNDVAAQSSWYVNHPEVAALSGRPGYAPAPPPVQGPENDPFPFLSTNSPPMPTPDLAPLLALMRQGSPALATGGVYVVKDGKLVPDKNSSAKFAVHPMTGQLMRLPEEKPKKK